MGFLEKEIEEGTLQGLERGSSFGPSRTFRPFGGQKSDHNQPLDCGWMSNEQ